MVKLNNRTRSATLGLVVLTSMTWSAGIQALAQGGKADQSVTRCSMEHRIQLTADQKKKMRALNGKFQSENGAAIKRLKAQDAQLQKLGAGEATRHQREQLVRAVLREREALHAKRMVLMKQVLSPEQISQFETMREQCKEKQVLQPVKPEQRAADVGKMKPRQ